MLKPRYVFVSSEDDRHLVKGGIGTYLGVLVRTLGRRGCRVDWLSESPTERDFIEREGPIRRHYLSRRSGPGRLDLRQFARKLDLRLQEIVTTGPDDHIIVEAPDWEGLLSDSFAAWSEYGNILRVTRIHTPLAVCRLSHSKVPTSEDIDQMQRERLQLERSDLLSSPSRYTLDATLEYALQNHTPPCPTVVIGNCVDSENFRPGISTVENAIEELARLTRVLLSKDRFRIFVVGSVEERKGAAIIQRALPRLLISNPAVEVCWLGHLAEDLGPPLNANPKMSRAEFIRPLQAFTRSRIHLAGFVPHDRLPHIYPAGDLFLFCYRRDNFPGALAEVALSGRPIIALMRGGVPEMICKDGRPLALTLTSGSDEAVARELVDLVSEHIRDPEPGRMLAADLRRHIIESFSEEAVEKTMRAGYVAALRGKEPSNSTPGDSSLH